MKYASAFKRLLAFAVDRMILFAIYIGLGLGIAYSSFSQRLLTLPLLGIWFLGSVISIALLYHAFLESSPWQATIGKKLFNLCVIDINGERISFLRACIRYFSQKLSYLFGFLGLLLIFFTSKKQTLHDKITSTLVIEK